MARSPQGAADRRRMRWILFYVFVGFFIVITALTLVAIFTPLITLPQDTEDALFKVYVAEVGIAVGALFYSVFGLRGARDGADAFEELVSEIPEEGDADLPDLSGLSGSEWNSRWFVEGDATPYVNDKVWIDRVTGTSVGGHGRDAKGEYDFSGIFLRGVLALAYRYRADGSALAGVAVLKFGALSRRAEGKWYGYTVEDKITGGTVSWERA